MAEQRLIVAIGRIERALSRIEQISDRTGSLSSDDLVQRHETLKAETRTAIADIDRILEGAA
jgi:hypothetical protein